MKLNKGPDEIIEYQTFGECFEKIKNLLAEVNNEGTGTTAGADDDIAAMATSSGGNGGNTDSNRDSDSVSETSAHLSYC